MGKTFPHRLYLSAAVALAAGGYTMTAGIISGEPGELHRLIDAYLHWFRIMVIAMAGAAVYSRSERTKPP